MARRWLALLLAVAVAGCGGGGGGGTSAAQGGTAAALAIDGFAPSTAAVGAEVTVTGTALDTVTAVRIGAVAQPFETLSAGKLRFRVAAATPQGPIELASAGAAVRSTASFVPAAAPAIEALAPAAVLWGQTLRLRGAALARAVRVRFAGEVEATPSAARDDELETVVPDGARSGAVTVLLADGARVLAPAALEVNEPVRVDAQAVHRVVAGATFTITGSGLAGVTAATIGTVAAAIEARSNTALVLRAPAGVACGAITLAAAGQPAVPAGLWHGTEGCAIRAAAIEFAQVLLQPGGDPYQRLVPGREAWLRVVVVADAAGQSAPSVRAHAAINGAALGALTLSGPQTLPQLPAGAELPASIRYDQRQSFIAALPAEWVQRDLEVTVEIDGAARLGSPIVSVQRPAVGDATAIDLVLVPLVSGAHAPALPPPAEALDELQRRLPVARGNLRVSLRAPYTLATVADGVASSADWSAALRELEQLRRSEAPARVYFGLVKPMSLASSEGLGYVNASGMASPSLSAVGLDASRSRWPAILVHELGHLFGRPHAPCGIAGDPNFPYANGALGPAGLFDSLLAAVVSPLDQTDVMGYCGGRWFSDYNYRNVQSFLESLAPSIRTAQQARAAVDVIAISGSIAPDGVRFAPPRAQRGQPSAPRGEYRLRIETAGGVLEVPFEASPVDHAQRESHFFVTIADPGPIRRLQVWHGTYLLSESAATPR